MSFEVVARKVFALREPLPEDMISISRRRSGGWASSRARSPAGID